MLRPFAIGLLVLVSACAARTRPPEPVAAAPAMEPAEPLDPAIRPLSQEIEEAARSRQEP